MGLYDCSHSGRLALLPFVTFSLNRNHVRIYHI
nr:MAG TPA: hypothetical protein [Caudoviricetes sp.]